MALGGEGVISVVSNVVPRLVADLCRVCASGDLAAARAIDASLQPLISAAFVETNPIPVKAMLHYMGRIANRLRLPLVPLDTQHNATVWSAFHQLQTYQAQVPSLFNANTVLIASDGVHSRIGALGAG